MRGILCAVFLYTIADVDSARILGVFPMPSVSHQVVFRAYMHELVKHGHEIVIITPNAVLPKNRPKDNITEIDIGSSYKILMKLWETNKHQIKRGTITDWTFFNAENFGLLLKIFQQQFENPAIQELLQGTHKFDLLVIEALVSYSLIFSHYIKAPVIQFSSFYGVPDNFDTMGAIGRHSILHPHPMRNKFIYKCFWDKLNAVYKEIVLENESVKIQEVENKMLKQHYGPNAPTVLDLKRNVDLFFINSHPIFDNNRPVPPSVVYLGALHMKPLKELPKDLKEYLDNSKRGVVYVSLGAYVKYSDMDKDMLDTFLNAFDAMPYDVLWKFDADSLENVPKNTKWQKWFPQRDLLAHPNLKVFVTQGGLQSTDEAIEATVPLVGIPLAGDQWYNVQKYEDLGIGVQLDSMAFTETDLVNAVSKVIGDGSYKKNLQRLKSVIQDQPETPLERAVWWTEYVLRHGGARHLRSPAANMSWSEYYLLDLLIPIAIFVLVLLLILSVLVYRIYKSARASVKQKKS